MPLNFLKGLFVLDFLFTTKFVITFSKLLGPTIDKRSLREYTKVNKERKLVPTIENNGGVFIE